MELDILRKVGLTEGEIKVYSTLLRGKEFAIGDIGRDSKVSKSKIYDILDRLMDKGLAGYVVRNGVRYFSSTNPNMILEYLDQKSSEFEKTRQEAQKIIPFLSKEHTINQRPAQMVEGFRGLQSVREELLNELQAGDELLVMGAPKIANERWEGWLLDFHKKRESKGIAGRILYNSNAQEYGKKRSKFKRLKVRYLPNEMVSPNWVDVFNNAVLLVIVLKEPISIVIRDKSLADSFRSYFEIIWKMSKN